MNEAYVEINGVSSKVTTWGRWIEEGKGSTDEIIIIIPGNPGIPGFYNLFAKTLHEKTEIPVWCLSHAGHNLASGIKYPDFSTNKKLYNLRGQVEHKIDFFKKYVPKDAKVHLVCHSIGSYMALEILEHPDVKVHKSYLLFPTIEKMAKTYNGKFMNTLIKPIVGLVVLLCWIYTLLPKFISTFLLYIYMFVASVPADLHTKNIQELLKPSVLKRVFFLAFDEMELVKERNNGVIRKYVRDIKFLYGKTDGWAPEAFWACLKREIPEADAELTDVNHAFVFRKSVDVGVKVAGWIKA